LPHKLPITQRAPSPLLEIALYARAPRSRCQPIHRKRSAFKVRYPSRALTRGISGIHDLTTDSPLSAVELARTKIAPQINSRALENTMSDTIESSGVSILLFTTTGKA
jgi:hypothetical protein